MARTDLHELFDAATADLSPLPDLVPEARRIVRRRRLATRSLGAALSAALVIGAGTFALDSPSRSSGDRTASTTTGAPADFGTQVAALLQPIWPISGEVVTVPDKALVESVEISAGGGYYPLWIVAADSAAPTPDKTEIIRDDNIVPSDEPPVVPAVAYAHNVHLVVYRHNVRVSFVLLGTPATLISEAQLRTMAATPQFDSIVKLAIADRGASR